MPLIHDQQYHANPKITRRLEEHAYTQEAVNLKAPTIPLHQETTLQISSEDIALIILTAIFILISGAAAIRLAHLIYCKKEVIPRTASTCKTVTESSSTLPLTSWSTPRGSSSIKHFTEADDMNDACDFTNQIVERDITFSFPFARPESPPGLSRQPPAFMREEEEDIAAMLSIRAGQESACRRCHKERKESESSRTTASTAQDSLCPSEPRSSVTSVYSISVLSEDEEEDVEEVEVYEVKRAQTQSMEVKRGVLMTWRTSRPPGSMPDMPTVVISESSSDTGALNTVTSGNEGFLQPLPALLVTQPSNISLVSTTSTVSVDLDEFPLPPSLPPFPKTQAIDIPLMLEVPAARDSHCQTYRMSREEKRSTVEQVITLYEGY
ncbi:hypothetical protein EV361DRAFT_896109 [Lentinula raphanica]|nr:hypothetical protein EV361DRAFT_896109 [Lentinula raphanica]